MLKKVIMKFWPFKRKSTRAKITEEIQVAEKQEVKMAIEPREDYSYYEFKEDDIDDTWWVWDMGHTPPGAPWSPMFTQWWMYGATVPLAQALEDAATPRSKGPRSRSNRGYHMVTVSTPHNDAEIQERAERYRQAVLPWLQDPDKILNDIKAELSAVYEKYKNYDYAKAGWQDLMQWVHEWEIFCHRHWYLHFWAMVSTGAIFVDWENLSSELLGMDAHHPTFQRLMRGFDNNNFETERQLHAVAQKIIDEGLKDTVLNNKPEEILPRLETSEAGKRVLAEFNKFLDNFGWRNFMMDTYTTPTWREDSTPAIVRIQQFINFPTFKLDEIIAKQATERKQAEEEIVNKLPVDQREWYRILMAAGQKASVWAEDHSFFFEMQSHSVGRYFWLAVGKRLVEAGALDKADDIFMLVPQEVLKILSDPYRVKGQKIAQRRRAEWDDAKNFWPEPYYGRIPQPDAMMEMMSSQDVIFTKVTQEKPPEPRPELKADLIGVSGSPGVVEGVARVIMSPAQMGEVQEGEILVAPITDSTWTPVFSIVKGVVLNTGAPLCHAAIIAREYGLPAVVNTGMGTDVIKTGQRIMVDADVGAVYILDK